MVLAVIEDHGDGTKGESKSELDKMYYFSNGKVLQELSNKKETEYTVKESDAKELISEFNEYKEIFQKIRK